MAKQSEKSRHIGGKPNTRDEADNRKQRRKGNVAAGRRTGSTMKPEKADVGNRKKDR